MSDLIDRQAAIDAIECIVDHHCITPYQTMRAAIDHAKRIMSGLPSAQPEPHWIPVSERLPEQKGIYPVWTAKGFGDHLSASYWDGEEWTLRVIAWMPLPEPYREEGEADVLR